MAIVRFNHPLFSDLFDEMFPDSSFGAAQSGLTLPRINIAEGENHYRIEVAAPGYDKSDFTIQTDSGVLVVSAERETNSNDDYLIQEFEYAGFKRAFELPQDADGQSAKASYKNGVLTITIPRKQKPDTRKSIQVS
ncbi:MAG: hypothetical protein Kow0075_01760 [Salibacteraceae bacterium]